MTVSLDGHKLFVNYAKPDNYWNKLFAVLTIFIGICIFQYLSTGKYFFVWILPFAFIYEAITHYTFKQKSEFFTVNSYLTLYHEGVHIKTPTNNHFIPWSEVTNIDKKHMVNSPSYYYIFTNREYRIDKELLGERTNEVVVLLKRYAEHYGTARFIY